MAITGVLAQATVTDLDAAEEWYTAFFDRPPDARPMDGLLEWHLGGDATGVQVWAEPDRAGRSSVVLQVDDLDAHAARLAEAGLTDATPQSATSSRILQVADPDGNRLVLTGT
ncbi:VOC family protein [Iamia majanohamensis]|uniref:VOC family protein n=1 Tax=Iamia majanohamensis TaxID=467976 RepID=A0AAE9Y7S0_9ACTN|nr:VOC family protein [Iamia majanohamensis]WCO67261.1 VOC family protein [Iamia majanohamensis]